jgi:hypothetical protein
MKVTDYEHVHDSKALSEFVNDVIKSNSMTITTTGKLFAGVVAYEGNNIFRYLSTDNEILHCIKVRKNDRVRWKKGHIKKSISYISEK